MSDLEAKLKERDAQIAELREELESARRGARVWEGVSARSEARIEALEAELAAAREHYKSLAEAFK